MNGESLYALALSLTFRHSPANALQVWQLAGSGKAVWESRNDIRALIPQATDKLAAALHGMDAAMATAERELEFAASHGISVLAYSDNNYPARLKSCCDAPLVLFHKGNANLNARRIISVVGTRHCTEYGKKICEDLTRGLSSLAPGTLVVSGLAYGVDIHAHRGALDAHLPTVAVLAHGLDRIYPTLHRDTAMSMTANGGLLTEFPSGTNPDKQNFIRRNRIIAGLADVTVVVESAAKGGGLITASIAASYNREVCAFPGRVSDQYSEGCNRLIQNSKATLITSADDLVKAMKWDSAANPSGIRPVELELFPTLSPEEQKISDCLENSDGKQINLLTAETGIPVQQLMSMLFEMEMRGIVKSLNGARYKLNR